MNDTLPMSQPVLVRSHRLSNKEINIYCLYISNNNKEYTSNANPEDIRSNFCKLLPKAAYAVSIMFKKHKKRKKKKSNLLNNLLNNILFNDIIDLIIEYI